MVSAINSLDVSTSPARLASDTSSANCWKLLEYYNNCDVIPMVEAINKMFAFYRAKNLDMFKDAISFPGLAYKMLMNCPNANNQTYL